MGSSTRIYNKFEHWSVEDCACMHCVNYVGEGLPCPLEVCCCADIKEEAIRRKQTANIAHTSGAFATGKGVLFIAGS